MSHLVDGIRFYTDTKLHKLTILLSFTVIGVAGLICMLLRGNPSLKAALLTLFCIIISVICLWFAYRNFVNIFWPKPSIILSDEGISFKSVLFKKIRFPLWGQVQSVSLHQIKTKSFLRNGSAVLKFTFVEGIAPQHVFFFLYTLSHEDQERLLTLIRKYHVIEE